MNMDKKIEFLDEKEETITNTFTVRRLDWN